MEEAVVVSKPQHLHKISFHRHCHLPGDQVVVDVIDDPLNLLGPFARAQLVEKSVDAFHLRLPVLWDE